MEGSEKFAIALVVLSRANAARENSPLRDCLGGPVEEGCLEMLLWRVEVDGAAAKTSVAEVGGNLSWTEGFAELADVEDICCGGVISGSCE
jgi:hypothetical protein